MTEWIERVITDLGYAGVALLTFAENVFPPLPSEVILPLAGFAAARGELSIVATIAAGSAGSLLGTSLYYAVGRLFPEKRVNAWVLSHGKWAAIRHTDLERARRWFDRHGRWAILACRCVPGLRTVVSLPAGLNKMPLSEFLFYSAVGTALWTGLLTAAGAFLGKNYAQVQTYLEPAAIAVLAALAGAVAIWIYRKRNDANAQRNSLERSRVEPMHGQTRPESNTD